MPLPIFPITPCFFFILQARKNRKQAKNRQRKNNDSILKIPPLNLYFVKYIFRIHTTFFNVGFYNVIMLDNSQLNYHVFHTLNNVCKFDFDSCQVS